MKGLKLKRLISLLVVFMLLIAGSVYAMAAEEDAYSAWASWEITMASNVYQLGNEQTYSNFKTSFTEEKFAPVHDSLNAKFDTDDELGIINSDAVTRGEVVEELYDIIVLAVDITGDASALDYFVKNGLINGRASGQYQLDKTCTTEEMIVFSVRVYEFICYQLDLDSAGLFWKITGKDAPNTIYLLGSMHLGDSSVYPMSKAIIKAFNISSYLGVEVNIYTMSEEDQAYLMDIQFLSDGTTIKDHISGETYALLVEVAEYFGMPEEVYNYLKPWAAMLGIQQAMAGDASAADATNPMLGIDMHFLMRAVNFGMPIVELESVRYQLEMFDSYSPELQEYLLLSVLAQPGGEDEENAPTQEEIAEYVRMYNAILLEAIKSGDEATLTALLTADRDYENPLMNEFNTKLWDIRDAAMADAVEAYLNAEDAQGDFFIIVGAGHTVGDTGIVSVMLARGYTVERIGK